MQYRISYSSGKDKSHKNPRGSLREVRRDFTPQYADEKRTKDNIIIKNETIAEAYENVFGEAQNEYNRKQKRKDRKIGNYFESLFGVKPDTMTAEKEIIRNKSKMQSFYEWVVGIGDMYNAGLRDSEEHYIDEYGQDQSFIVPANPEAAAKMTEILKEYAEGWQERNSNLYLVCAAIHLDEHTPHLHIDAVPWSDGYKKGMYRQQGMDSALGAMGFKGARESLIGQWQKREREELQRIAKEHGIEIAAPEESRGETLRKDELAKLNAVKHARQVEEQQLVKVQGQRKRCEGDFKRLIDKRQELIRENEKAQCINNENQKILKEFDEECPKFKNQKKKEVDEETERQKQLTREHEEQQRREYDKRLQDAYNRQIQQTERELQEILTGIKDAADEINGFYGDRIHSDLDFREYSDNQAMLREQMSKYAGVKNRGAPRMSDLNRCKQPQHTDDYSL